MFDNPDQELKRLEDQLLKAEMTDEEFERFYDDIFEEFADPALKAQHNEDLLEGSPVGNVRNYANGYGTQNRPAQNRPVQQRPAQQRPVQQRPVQQRPAQARPVQQQRPAQSRPVQQRPAPAAQSANQPRATRSYAAPVQRDNTIKALTITACVECAGIVGVVLWWLIRIL